MFGRNKKTAPQKQPTQSRTTEATTQTPPTDPVVEHGRLCLEALIGQDGDRSDAAAREATLGVLEKTAFSGCLSLGNCYNERDSAKSGVSDEAVYSSDSRSDNVLHALILSLNIAYHRGVRFAPSCADYFGLRTDGLTLDQDLGGYDLADGCIGGLRQLEQRIPTFDSIPDADIWQFNHAVALGEAAIHLYRNGPKSNANIVGLILYTALAYQSVMGHDLVAALERHLYTA